MAILSKLYKPGNPLKLIFITLGGVHCSNFVGCQSFFESNSPNFFALYEKNLEDWCFSVRGYFSLIQKDSVNHLHVFTVYAKEGVPFLHNLSFLKFQGVLFSTGFTSVSVLPPFLSQSPSFSLGTVFRSCFI